MTPTSADARSASAVAAEMPTRLGSPLWTWVATVEVVLAAGTVVLDLGLPTLVLLGMAVVSLVIRRIGLASLGFHRVHRGWRLAGTMLLVAAVWTVVSQAVFIPLANHLSGQRQDVSDFAGIQGNVGMLAAFVLLSWTLAAVGEELAYRGYILTRITDVIGSTRVGVVLAVGISSLLFGLAHSEQGIVGVTLTTIDAVIFSVLRYRYQTLWAPVLAHGFKNTIGVVAFFLIGPVYGFW
jgi:membrane protease YdiL (CAAX protease family)